MQIKTPRCKLIKNDSVDDTDDEIADGDFRDENNTGNNIINNNNSYAPIWST